MAFDGAYLKLLVSGGSDHPNLWSYKTADAAATVDTADYFLAAHGMGLKALDVIIRSTVTNLGASNEAFSASGLHVVNAASATSVDVADAVNLGGTDTD